MSFEAHVAAAVAVSIALWKDATPNVAFPSADELVRIELGRVLLCDHAMRTHGVRVDPGLLVALHAPPWDVPDPVALLQTFVRQLDPRIDRAALGDSLLRHGHESRYMLPPKQKTHDPGDIEQLAKRVAKALRVTEVSDVQRLSTDRYEDLHKCLCLAS